MLRDFSIGGLEGAGARHDPAWASMHWAAEGAVSEAEIQVIADLSRHQQTLGALDYSGLHRRLLVKIRNWISALAWRKCKLQPLR